MKFKTLKLAHYVAGNAIFFKNGTKCNWGGRVHRSEFRKCFRSEASYPKAKGKADESNGNIWWLRQLICYTGLMSQKVILQNSRKWTALSVDQGENKMKSFLWSFWDLTAFVFEAEKAAVGWARVQCHLLKERLCFVEGASLPLIMAKELFSPERLQLSFSLSENDHSAWLTVL